MNLGLFDGYLNIGGPGRFFSFQTKKDEEGGRRGNEEGADALTKILSCKDVLDENLTREKLLQYSSMLRTCDGGDEKYFHHPLFHFWDRGATKRYMSDESDLSKPLPLVVQARRFTVLLFIAFLYLAAALNVTTIRMPDPKTEKELPDVGFDVLPQMPQLEHVTDAILWTLNVMCGFVLLRLYAVHCNVVGEAPLAIPIFSSVSASSVALPNKNDELLVFGGSQGQREIHHIAWIRYTVTFTIVTALRVVVILATSLPATDNACQHPEPIKNPLLNILLAMTTFGSASIHCGDLLYSGHTVSITLSFICLWTYAPVVFSPAKRANAVRYVALLLMATSWLTIVASRSHYTDDVIVAVYVTLTTFWLIPHSSNGAPMKIQLLIRRLWHLLECRTCWREKSIPVITEAANCGTAEAPPVKAESV